MKTNLLADNFSYIKDAAKPLYDLLNVVIPVVCGVGCALLLLFAIVKLVVAAKAEDDGEAAKKRKQAIWCLVTMVIFVVLTVLYVALKDNLIQAIEDNLQNAAIGMNYLLKA